MKFIRRREMLHAGDIEIEGLGGGNNEGRGVVCVRPLTENFMIRFIALIQFN